MKTMASLALALTVATAAAAALMQKQGVAINDLFAFITPHLAKVQPPKDVHFNGEGYDLLGKQVAAAIQSALK
jgi:acyl-CoA thioesterase-1